MKRAIPYLLCLAIGAMLGFAVALVWRLDFMVQKQELRTDLVRCRLENHTLYVCCTASDADKY